MSNTVISAQKTDISEIHRAIEVAGKRQESRPGRWAVFFEDREDLTVRCHSAMGLGSTQTRHSGISARRGLENSRWVYVSDPGPDDVEAVLRAAVSSEAKIPTRKGDLHRSMGGLDPVNAAAWLTRLENTTRQALPRAEVTASWIGFRQDVLIGLPGQAPVADCRKGARLRLEVRLATSNSEALAVEEMVLRDAGAPSPALMAQMSDRAVSRVERRLALKDPPLGDQTVVFAPGVGGVVIHEIVGHALEADVAQRGSWLSSRTDRVAPKSVVVVDDPRRSRASWKIDDEGEMARAVPLIMQGRVRDWLVDRKTGAATGRTPNGHGRRASFREPVRPRMGCTFLGAGSLPAGEVIEATTGIYVRRMESAFTDPMTGQVTFRVTDAEALHNGKFAGPLRPHLLHVEGARLLAGIECIGNDLTFDTCIGSCHRDGQAIAMSVGAPTFRIGLARVTA